jgi:hypothetical protein
MPPQGLRELIGRAMIDPEFLADLERSPDTVLAQFRLSDEESKAVRRALVHLTKTPPSKRARELHSALIRRVAT